MRVLLISTYELGRQPVHLAAPAASLRAAGHEVRTADLAVETLGEGDLAWAERVAVSVPMHTATRLADQVVAALADSRPDLPVALYGLYAAVGAPVVDARISGEYEPALLEWVDGEAVGDVAHLGRSALTQPDRDGLPPLGEYARLEVGGATRLAGSVEASHGCRHRCRHCPIPAVYDGRIRVVPSELVLADIDALVAAGAGHISFGDADFLNAPAHSMGVLREAHAAHPDVTFDATIKVEHLLRHDVLVREMADLSVLFVVSAFESVDERTLLILDKGHTVADMTAALDLAGEAGIALRPTWLPFFPWTTPRDVADVFGFLHEHRLAGVTDPVQMAIRLLVPRGSLLEAHPEVAPHLTGYDESALTWRWEFADPESAVLHKELEAIAAEASDCGAEAVPTLDLMARSVAAAADVELHPFPSDRPGPRLTESWFCCAEPTGGQAVTIGMPRR